MSRGFLPLRDRREGIQLFSVFFLHRRRFLIAARLVRVELYLSRIGCNGFIALHRLDGATKQALFFTHHSSSCTSSRSVVFSFRRHVLFSRSPAGASALKLAFQRILLIENLPISPYQHNSSRLAKV